MFEEITIGFVVFFMAIVLLFIAPTVLIVGSLLALIAVVFHLLGFAIKQTMSPCRRR